MKYYKRINGNYITALSINSGGVGIDKTEYDQIMQIIQSKPKAPNGKDYRLTDDLTWELYDLPPIPADDELTDEELGKMVREGMM